MPLIISGTTIRKLGLLLLMGAAMLARADTTIRVVDAANSEPLAAATVFANSGIILGLTDSDGNIAVANPADFPITVRCVGYEPRQCSGEDTEVRLATLPVALHEIVVTPVDRPVARIICFVREYISGATDTDTLMCYNEHMADFFMPTRKKIKGFRPKTEPRFLRSRLYSRMSNSEGLDSIFSPDYRNDTFSWEDLVEMPRKEVVESAAILAGAPTDSIAGKHGTKHKMRKTDDSYTVVTDYLADEKNHTLSPFIFRMLGLSIEFRELQGSWVYQSNGRGRYLATDIVSGTFSLSVLGKGRWIRKAFNTESPIQMYGFYEIYPVAIEYLTPARPGRR